MARGIGNAAAVGILSMAVMMGEPSVAQERPYLLEKVDDVGICQLYADGFERLAAKDKILCWHLYQAVLAGRDIYISQKCAEGPFIRDLMEEILTHSDGVDPATLSEIRRYTKLFWVNNGPYSYITSRT